MFTKFVAHVKRTMKTIDEVDGRVDDLVTKADEPHVYSEHHTKSLDRAREYLISRKKLASQFSDFQYIPSVSTDVRATMRDYVANGIPHVATKYQNLFDRKCEQ